jgi:hypothetical protein
VRGRAIALVTIAPAAPLFARRPIDHGVVHGIEVASAVQHPQHGDTGLARKTEHRVVLAALHAKGA